MNIDRRKFLKIAGVSVLGFSVKPAVDLLWQDEVDASEVLRNPKALTGKRWAMVIDTKKCSGQKECKACIEACHRFHNVPNIPDPKREIKWIWKEDYEHAFTEQKDEYNEEVLKDRLFILLCNHCKNPPCVRVCPTKATFQRKDGIVMMDMHRCIGCRFCMAACPYGSRSFNWQDPRPFIKEKNHEYPTRTKGVVEKCDFCAERLDKGLLPLCVEACKEKALIFGDLGDPNSEISKILHSHYTIKRKPGLGTGPQIYYIV